VGYNRIVFETWIETCLVKCLKPGQCLVINNATFHKGRRIEMLIEQAGCKVLYLPPYSSDLNKIEQCWSWLKSQIRKCRNEFNSLRDGCCYSPLLSLSLTKNRRRSLQALSQKVLKLYLAIDSSIVEICDRSLCSRGLGLCSLESDRRGIDNWSLWLDLKILLLTVKKVFKQEGISQSADVVAMPEFFGNDK